MHFAQEDTFVAINALCERRRRTEDDDFFRAGTDIEFFMSAGSVTREENSVNEAFYLAFYLSIKKKGKEGGQVGMWKLFRIFILFADLSHC